ncbi:MAG: 4-hydroxy-tetrahydrodipicolinate reductase [Firmicutes bacterium]|nr:4-hydroxy-tetrahydrodipicolinate reductase [Bacillota bacterium]
MQEIPVVIAGATGKVGREVVRAVLREPGFRLVGAIARSAAGRDIGEALGLESGPVGVPVAPDLPSALSRPEAAEARVLVDFSSAEAFRSLFPEALRKRLALVVGTTGFTQEELAGYARACREAGVGAAFIANFAIGAMLMMKFAAEARKYFPHVEIVEMHHHTKRDAPSGTALRTRARLEAAQGDLQGPPVPIHSVRLPGLVAHQEVIFGGPGQVLTIRHDATSRECYVPGVLLACRWVLAHPGEVAFDLEQLTR